MTNTQEAIMTETYQDVEARIRATTWKFCRVYKGDFDEAIGNANLFFMEAYHNYDPETGVPFEQYVTFYVWKNLLSIKRTAARRHRILPQCQLTDLKANTIEASNGKIFQVEELGLSQESKTIIKYIMAKPSCVRLTRTSIKRELQRQGWTRTKIAECFEEISNAIS